MEFRYSGGLPDDFSDEQATSLIEISEKYQLDSLKIICQDKLISRFFKDLLKKTVIDFYAKMVINKSRLTMSLIKLFPFWLYLNDELELTILSHIPLIHKIWRMDPSFEKFSL